jgi:hypothetical protein
VGAAARTSFAWSNSIADLIKAASNLAFKDLFKWIVRSHDAIALRHHIDA